MAHESNTAGTAPEHADDGEGVRWDQLSAKMLAYLGGVASRLSPAEARAGADNLSESTLKWWRTRFPDFAAAERLLREGAPGAGRRLAAAILDASSAEAAARLRDISLGKVKLQAREYDSTVRALRGLLDAAGATRGPGARPTEQGGPAGEGYIIRVVYDELPPVLCSQCRGVVVPGLSGERTDAAPPGGAVPDVDDDPDPEELLRREADVAIQAEWQAILEEEAAAAVEAERQRYQVETHWDDRLWRPR